jgi:hypothetical protein
MAYRSNPFLERVSDHTTSDHDFVRLFAPKIVEKIPEAAFQSALHIFTSSPGAGKTTLLRAFTPTALRAFWNSRRHPQRSDAYQALAEKGLIDDEKGPQLLGALLSCASGYADLPSGTEHSDANLFRALLDCRVVLRTLRNLAALLGFQNLADLNQVSLTYSLDASDIKTIPLNVKANELIAWAEDRERRVYEQLDSLNAGTSPSMPSSLRFESVLWLQSVQFSMKGQEVAPRRLLMIDDFHKLRRKQRALLIEELTEMRSKIPIWLAERSIALGNELLSQGSRLERDIHYYSLEEIWGVTRGSNQFASFAQNILDRRLDVQSVIPPGAFSEYLRDELRPEDSRGEVAVAISRFQANVEKHGDNPRYAQWLDHASDLLNLDTFSSVREVYRTRILLVRDAAKRQLSLQLIPLSTNDLEERDNSQVQGAAEIFMREELHVPYYFGTERLCTLATNNVEELLALAAALYDALQAKQILRKSELLLSPAEQEKALREVAKARRDFIPKNHTEGTRAQRLLDSIGAFCRERTFLPSAPYAPGVTGIRLSNSELQKLEGSTYNDIPESRLAKRVLSECVAENLLFVRPSQASASREAGTVFYLNRTLCMYHGLPLQLGGWQDVLLEDLIEWMERGGGKSRRQKLEID